MNEKKETFKGLIENKGKRADKARKGEREEEKKKRKKKKKKKKRRRIIEEE